MPFRIAHLIDFEDILKYTGYIVKKKKKKVLPALKKMICLYMEQICNNKTLFSVFYYWFDSKILKNRDRAKSPGEKSGSKI